MSGSVTPSQGRLGLLAAAMALASPAGAEEPSPRARFEYVRGPGAEACPDELAVRNAIAARLGYFPFQDDAPLLVQVDVGKGARGLRATIRLTEAPGRRQGARELVSPEADCAELAGSLALAISLAIDPLSSLRSPPAAPPRTPAQNPTPPPPPAAPPPEVPQVLPPPKPAGPLVGGGVLLHVGSAPSLLPAIALEVRGAEEGLSWALQAFLSVPTEATLPLGAVRTFLVGASAMPCVQASLFTACLVATAGALQSEGLQLDDARSATTLYLTLGARAGLRVFLSPRLWAGAHFEASARLVQLALVVNDMSVWNSPALVGGGGVSLGARLP